jgi:hypothetical protein
MIQSSPWHCHSPPTPIHASHRRRPDGDDVQDRAAALERRENGLRRTMAAKLVAFERDDDDRGAPDLAASQLIGRVGDSREDQAAGRTGAPDGPPNARHHFRTVDV